MQQLSQSELFQNLSNKALRYLFPGYKKPVEEALCSDAAHFSVNNKSIEENTKLPKMVSPTPKPSRKKRPLSPSNHRNYSYSVKPDSNRISRKKVIDSQFLDLIIEAQKEQEELERERRKITPEVIATARQYGIDIPDEAVGLQPETVALILELRKLQDKYGVTIKDIESALDYTARPSHLVIKKNNKIYLKDFNNREVKMDTLAKTVFFFYLKHPEGVAYCDLCDHRAEIEDIYMSISGRSDMEAMRQSIDRLIDPVMDNSINVKVSHVKSAFCDVVEDRIAKYYYLSGKPGEVRRIPIDRSYVIWE